ncbi:MAG: MFS transporter [Chloroflexi bacterium]|nr:MFS transporter [Chloroflexota bacterium]
MPPIPANSTPPAPPRGLRALPRNIWALGLTSFFTDISSEMVLNLVPLFLANVLGVRTAVIGLIEGVAETTASLLKVYSGYLSDRLGQRKNLAVMGYGLSAVAKPLLYFANSWGWVLAVRFADRAGKGLRTAPRDALVADSTGEGQRGLAFGVHRAADTAGAMLGMIVAALAVWGAEAGLHVLTRSTFQTVVLLSVPRLSLRAFDARFRAFLLIVVLFTLGNSSDAFLILRAQERGLSVLQVMGMLISFTLVYTLVSGPAGALSDRIGRRRLIVGGWLAYGLIYLGFALAGAGWQVWALYAAYGVYYGMVEGTAKAFVADLVLPELRGTAYGVYNAAVGLTAFPASFIAGLLWQGAGGWSGFGPSAPFYFGAALALLAALLIWRFAWLPRAAPPPPGAARTVGESGAGERGA